MNTKLKFDPLKTILVITIGFLTIFIYTHWIAALYIALTIGVIGVFSKYLTNKINYLWMKLTWILSLIIPNVLLSLIFYLLLTPIAFLSKLFKKNDELMLKNLKSSLFKTSNKIFNENSFKNPW